MIAQKEKARPVATGAGPNNKVSERQHSTRNRFRALLISAALGIQRFDAAVIAAALALAGWPR